MRMIALSLLCFASPALASPPENLVQVDVLPGWRAPTGEHIAGLKITLAPGWKTYWRAPGDAGIPPTFNFSQSSNIRAVAPQWPVPDVFTSNGMQTIGYSGSVVLPLRVYSETPDQPMIISGQIEIGVCEEICIPVAFDFDTALPASGDRDSAIVASLIDMPMSGADAGVNKVTCTIDPIRDGMRVTASFTHAPISNDEVVVIEAGQPGIWVSEAHTQRLGNQISATVDMVHYSGQPFALDRSRMMITLLGDHKAIEMHGCMSG